jgi:hypothetical protein
VRAFCKFKGIFHAFLYLISFLKCWAGSYLRLKKSFGIEVFLVFIVLTTTTATTTTATPFLCCCKSPVIDVRQIVGRFENH